VVHRFRQCAAITAAYIPDHAIDIEEQNGAGEQGTMAARLVS
jgi:hypothetical protein